MKKNYVKPEIVVYDFLPCAPLATSKVTGETEGLGGDGDFNWDDNSSSEQPTADEPFASPNF